MFDENEVALFEGEVDVAQALLELPFNHIFFTGSTRVGKIVMAAAAQHLATVTLELGGKSPVIIDEGADIEAIGAGLAGAKQFNGGQACICPDYVFVREEDQDRLVEAFRANVATNLYEGGQIKKELIAQIVNAGNFARVKGLFDDAIAQGRDRRRGRRSRGGRPDGPPDDADRRHAADEDPPGGDLRARSCR